MYIYMSISICVLLTRPPLRSSRAAPMQGYAKRSNILIY